MRWLFRLAGTLPLRLNHALGTLLGRLAWHFSPKHRQSTIANISQYAKARHLDQAATTLLINQAIAEQGKGFTELAIVWTASIARLERLFVRCEGWQHVETAKAAKHPIIFVTPHLGCFDIAGRYVASRLPITVLYRPPKQRWLEPIMDAGRARGGATTAPANAAGVRVLMKTLKTGGNIMILPDQVPAAETGGEGIWTDFFGRPAYTITLLPRLAQSCGATVLFFFAERLPKGAGYCVHFVPMAEAYSSEKPVAARQTNAMVEQLINMVPSQYLWGYNRYKRPAGAPPPPTIAARK